MKTGHWIGLVALVGGCSGSLSERASRVRVYSSAEQVSTCENLGEVRGNGTGSGGRKRAENQAREEALALGGDAIVIRDYTSGMFTGHVVEATAYRCQDRGAAVTTGADPEVPPAPPITEVRLPEPTTILVLDFRMLDGEQRIGRIIASMMGAELQRVDGLSVIGSSDIEAALDVEKRKDFLGCDETSCLAEIAGAMGTRLVLHGTVGSIGSMYAVNASVYDSRLGESKARVSRTVNRDEDALVRIVPELAAELARGVASAR